MPKLIQNRLTVSVKSLTESLFQILSKFGLSVGVKIVATAEK